MTVLDMAFPTGPETAFLVIGICVGVIIGLLLAAYIGTRWVGEEGQDKRAAR